MRCWLEAGALAFIRNESKRKAPKETGGVLLGYFVEDDVVVTMATWPGPGAKHSLASYLPDCEFDRTEIARMYEETAGVITYLGDWHSHPKGGCGLSEDDIITLANISNFKPAKVTAPVMLLGVKESRTWVPVAWRIQPSSETGFDYLLAPLDVVVFTV
jgi:integrative and conjugative element protein (TIGR02256 family)